ncbi:MAG TPA: hypothetical protein IGS52_06655 [Oscillatoriaceae cyanobacterium M33_DOE_052]|uniref:Uncharacterized protein n=1 Tax=Planktothricoides sp. SpSt-374 TaxID=2282167 RepID=A0A7C3ZVR7_9CYAN|nr:hypothetical protein [Oscillatoriaceae cyanobacterium M33_DOE_052]
MIRRKTKPRFFKTPSFLPPVVFFVVTLLALIYFVFGTTNDSPQKKIVELFFSDLSKDNKAAAKNYWCFRQNPLSQVSNWQLEKQRKNKSLDLSKANIDIEKVAAAFPDLKPNLYRLARFDHFQLVYQANISTKSGSHAMAKEWGFDVWETEKLLRYRKLAEAILSEMYAEVENPGQEGDDLLKSINAAKYAGQFAAELARHPVSGNLDDLSSLPYCILSVQEIKSRE